VRNDAVCLRGILEFLGVWGSLECLGSWESWGREGRGVLGFIGSGVPVGHVVLGGSGVPGSAGITEGHGGSGVPVVLLGVRSWGLRTSRSEDQSINTCSLALIQHKIINE